VRQLHGDVLSYRIPLPPPYGAGGGETEYVLTDVTPSEVALVAAGGLESALIDAEGIERRAVRRGEIDFHGSLQYFDDVTEIAGYLLDAGAAPREGNDVQQYQVLVSLYAPPDAPKGPVETSTLKRAAAIELLNPTVYAAIYGVVWRFLIRGESTIGVPAVRVGDWRVLPHAHVRLAPFGPEYVLGLRASAGERMLGIDFSTGTGPWGRFGGIEVEDGGAFSDSGVDLGGRAAVWKQFEPRSDALVSQLGALVVLTGSLAVPEEPLWAVAELGFKTEGYALGEALDGGPILRVGGAVRF